MPGPGARAQEADADASTATRILGAAEILFAQRGFAGVSVREIAGQVGLNQGSIYNHFPSKQALYEAVLQRGLTPFREILESAATELTGPDARDALLERLVDQLWRTPNIAKLIQREVLDDGEVLERLSEQWLRPIYTAGRAAMDAVPQVRESWAERDIPFVVLGMYHFLFGPFGSAALTRRVIGEEPLSEDMRQAHIDFLKRATHRLMGGA
jgi:AcrR family transcriptional regulator